MEYGINFDSKTVMCFQKHPNFYLHNSNWGSALPIDIINLLESVIYEFYMNLDKSKIITLPVYILNTSLSSFPRDSPERIKMNNHVLIYLSSQNRSWSQYSYQFSHELCHNVIDLDFPSKNDKYGWFEESLCELASLYTLEKMSVTWKINPPYPNWCDYSNSLNDYVSDIISKPENTLNIQFNEWFNNNIIDLYSNRCDRNKNRIIAIQLLPIFSNAPELWETIQSIKQIVITDEMSFDEYLLKWKESVSVALHSNFNNIFELFFPK